MYDARDEDENDLKTTVDTPEMGKRVQKAAEAFFEKACSTHFEHGQWWVHTDTGAYYSVCDALGGDAVDGFCFEQVSEDDDDDDDSEA